jgi:hypothetical protein
VYTDEDIAECHCGESRVVPPHLREQDDMDDKGDATAGGRRNWGPLGRTRPMPIRSTFPFEHRFPGGKSSDVG